MNNNLVIRQKLFTVRNILRLLTALTVIWMGLNFSLRFDGLVRLIGLILVLLVLYAVLYSSFQSIVVNNSDLIFHRSFGTDTKVDLKKIQSIRETMRISYVSRERVLVFNFFAEEEKQKKVYMGLSLFGRKEIDKLLKIISKRYPHVEVIKGPETIWLA